MRILVTGAKGFVGSAVLERLRHESSVEVSGAIRAISASQGGEQRLHVVGDIGPDTDWTDALQDIDAVIHLAARAHVLDDNAVDPLTEFRRVNVEGALALARQAIKCGVKRFVFISSIGVNGAVTDARPFSEQSADAPHAHYAQSKLEAENALKKLVQGSAMELVIIRPPLVYAENAPGNFRRLLKLVSTGMPLPFRSISNRRSMVALENLVDFIIACTRHPAAAHQTFLISDFEDLSIGEIVQLLGKGMGKNVSLLPIPATLLRGLARLAGKSGLYTQLCCSLQIDATKSQTLLGWTPPLTARSALIAVGRKHKERKLIDPLG